MKNILKIKPTHKLTKAFIAPGCSDHTFGRGSHVRVINPNDISPVLSNGEVLFRWPKTPVIVFTGKKANQMKCAIYDLRICLINGLSISPISKR